MSSNTSRNEKVGQPALSRRHFLYLATLGLAGAAASPFLVACGQSAPPPAPTPAAAKPATTSAPAVTKSATVVKNQSVQPLTGASASYGLRAQAGSELAVKEINDAGGFQDEQGNRYTLQVTKQDMANDRNEAIALLRQAASDSSVLAQLGPCNSVGFIPCVPVAGQVKMPLVGAGSVAPIKDWNIYTFRVNPVAETAMPVLVKAVVKKLNAKKIAFIHDQTQDGQVGSWEASKKTAQELGLSIVADEVFRTGEQDFSAQISKIKAGSPDVVGVMAAAGDGAKVCLQIVDGGIKVPMFTPDGAFLDTQYWDNSNGSFKGGFTWITADLETATGGLKKFLDDYAKAYPDLSPTSYSVYGYDAVYTTMAAIKKAGSATDREKLQKALASLDATTPVGTRVAFKNPPNGENQNPLVTPIQITDRGKYQQMQ